MDADHTRRLIESQIDNQMQLAAMATCNEVRAMHDDLVSLYRSQLACIIATERLTAMSDLFAFDLAA